jgi:hypothetical protein
VDSNGIMRLFFLRYSLCLFVLGSFCGCIPKEHIANPYEDLPFLRGSLLIETIDCANDSLETIVAKKSLETERDANKNLLVHNDSYNYPMFYFKYDSLYVRLDGIIPLDWRWDLGEFKIKEINFNVAADGRYFKNNQPYRDEDCSIIFRKECDDTTAFSVIFDYEIKNDLCIDRYHLQLDFTDRLIYSQKNGPYGVYAYRESYIQ